jgi:hypothetical protein
VFVVVQRKTWGAFGVAEDAPSTMSNKVLLLARVVTGTLQLGPKTVKLLELLAPMGVTWLAPW